jgi:hypothetical protein
MPDYTATVSATSAPTNVGIKIDGQQLYFKRDATGAWAASGDVVSQKKPVPFEFRAIGIGGDPVTLKISLNVAGGPSGSFNKNYTIPNDLLLIADDSIQTK